MHDLVIRAGLIVDGSGQAPFHGDVAVDAGRISAIGKLESGGRREIRADGALVAPGWVDIHTHYDGQATWDSELAPTSLHGVTTAVMGNCGVGFAPAHTGAVAHDGLINLMEGVEDIPGAALHEGLQWDWESFPDYLDALERRPHAIDLGTQIPHAPLRAYVMGQERGSNHEIEPTDDELDTFRRLTGEALLAGALGFATSRTVNHKSADGELIGSLTATDRELSAIGSALGSTGRGVFQCSSDFDDLDREIELLANLARSNRRPLSVTVAQHDTDPQRWRRLLDSIGRQNRDGLVMKGQVCSRAIGLMLSQEGSLNPFEFCPSYAVLAGLPVAERARRMRAPEVRERILAEYGRDSDGIRKHRLTAFGKMYVLGDPPDYEQPPSRSVAALAEASGVSPMQVIFDALAAGEGTGMIYLALVNYTDSSLDVVYEMINSPHSLFGLSDGGAHVGVVCDASFPTFNLTHWVRGRERGPRLPTEFVVHKQAYANARHMGLHDRGLLGPGFLADINVIDLPSMTLHAPRFAYDLPAGGRRLMQGVDGYLYTIKSGQVTFVNGVSTGELPGRVVRGARPAPSAA